MLVRWEPFGGLHRMDNLLDRFWSGSPLSDEIEGLAPRADAYETEDAYQYEFDLPGVEKKNVKAEIKDGVLTVRAENRTEKKENGKNYFLRERVSGQFIRAFSVPSDVDEGKLKATLENGTLHVSLPKGEKARSREIPIS